MCAGSETVQISTDFTEIYFPPLPNLEENAQTAELYAITECYAFLLEQLYYV